MTNHYFTNNNKKSNESELVEMVSGHKVVLKTDDGIFSKSHVDELTKLLIDNVISDFSGSSILDLGCGYGVVGITLAKHFQIDVDFVDVNERAVDLTSRNIELNGVNGHALVSDMFNEVRNSYDAIVLNPPIRAGKETCYKMYSEAIEYLNNNGILYIVISKKHGAISTQAYLQDIYSNIEILYKKKGVYIFKCIK